MAVTVEKQTVYLGAGLKSTGWVVWMGTHGSGGTWIATPPLDGRMM